jgi:hypothetical protein
MFIGIPMHILRVHIAIQIKMGLITKPYCNVDDEAFLGNDPVKQQWKGSDCCYAMAQYTGVNNGVEDVFWMVSAAVI